MNAGCYRNEADMIGSKLRMSEICKGIIMMVLTFCMLFSEPLQYKADGSTEYEKRLRVAFYPLEGFLNMMTKEMK